MRGTTSFLPLPPPVTIYMYLNYLYIQCILYMWYPHKQCILYMWYHFYSACKIYVLRVILRIKSHLFIHKHCSWSRMSKWMVQEELPKSIHILQKSTHRYFFLSLLFTVLYFIISLILKIITIYILVEIFSVSNTKKHLKCFIGWRMYSGNHWQTWVLFDGKFSVFRRTTRKSNNYL